MDYVCLPFYEFDNKEELLSGELLAMDPNDILKSLWERAYLGSVTDTEFLLGSKLTTKSLNL